MSLLALLNGIASITRVMVAFPMQDEGSFKHTFFIAYFLENLGQFGAIWFFAIKYYESA